MTKMSAGRAVVDVLKAEGVKFIFGMPGVITIGIYDALYGQQESPMCWCATNSTRRAWRPAMRN